MTSLELFWLTLSALVAGAVNAIAGGGTLITFPALLAILTPVYGPTAAVLANATSTVALVPGSFAAAWGYRRMLSDARRWLALLIVPSLVGGVIGSLLVTRLDPRYFDALVPWLILVATLLFLIFATCAMLMTACPAHDKATSAAREQPPQHLGAAGRTARRGQSSQIVAVFIGLISSLALLAVCAF